MPVLISQKESPREDAPGEQESPRPVQLPGSSESAEGAQISQGPVEASEADHRIRPGLRVMRTSPVILISCGLVFFSLIFLLDYMTQTGARADQAADRRMTSNSREKNQTAPASAHDNSARSNVPVSPPEPSIETTAAAAAPEGEAHGSVRKEDEEVGKQGSAPAPDPADNTDIQASGAAPPVFAVPQSEDGFTLQVGSFNELVQAQERAAKLGSVGVTAYVARVEIPKRGTWYRVQTGHFKSREEAVRYGTQLRSTGTVADFIVTSSKTV